MSVGNGSLIASTDVLVYLAVAFTLFVALWLVYGRVILGGVVM